MITKYYSIFLTGVCALLTGISSQTFATIDAPDSHIRYVAEQKALPTPGSMLKPEVKDILNACKEQNDKIKKDIANLCGQKVELKEPGFFSSKDSKEQYRAKVDDQSLLRRKCLVVMDQMSQFNTFVTKEERHLSELSGDTESDQKIKEPLEALKVHCKTDANTLANVLRWAKGEDLMSTMHPGKAKQKEADAMKRIYDMWLVEVK